jgi:predicted nucleic acid-binding protein
MKVYLDSSVMLAFLLEGRKELMGLPAAVTIGSSRLLWIETARVVDRAFRSGQLLDEDAAKVRVSFEKMAEGIVKLALSESVLDRAAGGFPVSIRTLDALHLAVALEWAGPGGCRDLEVWSFDRQMNLCAAGLGFRVAFL